MNIHSITQINNNYIFTNDNGKQNRVKTNKEDIFQILNVLETELKYIEYTVNQINKDLLMYNDKIEKLNNIIDSLNVIIDKGISENVPIYKRQLSNEHYEIEYRKKELISVCDNMKGVNDLKVKILMESEHYKRLIKECKYILRG